MPGESPELIGRYEIQAVLGRGAMGAVYKARDPQLDRVVAIKMVRTDLGLPPEHLAEYKRRFYQEAMAAGRLSHPNIVAIHDVMEIDQTPYIVMEYVDSDTLADLIKARGALTDAQAVDVVLQVCRALEYAHAHGIVHRDIKPANILVGKNGQVKVSDFGIARIEGQDFTQTGVRLGTPSYMSPEQIRGHLVDGRSDLFSLGAVLYEALTGQRPFRGTDTATLLYSILNDTPPPMHERNPLVERALGAVTTRALAKDREQRFLNARMFADALGETATGTHHGVAAEPRPSGPPAGLLRIARHRMARVAAACALIAIAGGIALAYVAPKLLHPDRTPLVERERANPQPPIAIARPEPPAPPAVSVVAVPAAEPTPPKTPAVEERGRQADGGKKGAAPAPPPPGPSQPSVAVTRPSPPPGAPPPPPGRPAVTVPSGSPTAPREAAPIEIRPEPERLAAIKEQPRPEPERPSAMRPPRLPGPPVESAPPAPPVAPRGDIVGRWQGRYQCQREEIGFSLNITNVDGNRVDAIFEFFPLPGTLSFPRGSYRMSGEYDRADRSIRLQNAGWIQRPLGVQSHDLEGQLDASGATISGRVMTSGCAHFVLARR
jgi:serine/threonine protein kinase